MRIFFLFSLILISVIGAGCLKKQPQAARSEEQGARRQPSGNPPVVAFGTTATSDAAINAELDAILKRFRGVKSFRMKFSQTTPQGAFVSTLEYLRPNRFRGTFQVGSQPATEIIVAEDSFYLRPSGGKWLDLSGTEGAKVVGTSLRNALSGDTSLDKLNVDPAAVVKKSRDDARECDLYRAAVRSPDGQPASLEICASEMLPKFVTITTQQGPLTFEYYDYGKLFLIERPA